MHEMLIPSEELEVVTPEPRLYDILEKMLNLQERMLDTIAPAMIYTTQGQNEEPTPCRCSSDS